MRILLLLTLCLPLMTRAVGDECVNEPTSNLKLFCQARAQASATQCDRITTLDSCVQCIAVVRKKQRELQWAIRPLDLATSDIRGDKKYIWNR